MRAALSLPQRSHSSGSLKTCEASKAFEDSFSPKTADSESWRRSLPVGGASFGVAFQRLLRRSALLLLQIAAFLFLVLNFLLRWLRFHGRRWLCRRSSFLRRLLEKAGPPRKSPLLSSAGGGPGDARPSGAKGKAFPSLHVVVTFRAEEVLLLGAADFLRKAKAGTDAAADRSFAVVDELLLPAVASAFASGVEFLSLAEANGVFLLPPIRRHLLRELRSLGLSQANQVPNPSFSVESRNKPPPGGLTLHSPALIELPRKDGSPALLVRILCGCCALPELLSIHRSGGDSSLREAVFSAENWRSGLEPETETESEGTRGGCCENESSGEEPSSRPSGEETEQAGPPTTKPRTASPSAAAQFAVKPKGQRRRAEEQQDKQEESPQRAQYMVPPLSVVRGDALLFRLRSGGSFPQPLCCLQAKASLRSLIKASWKALFSSFVNRHGKADQPPVCRSCLQEEKEGDRREKASQILPGEEDAWELGARCMYSAGRLLTLLLRVCVLRLEAALGPFDCLSAFGVGAVPPLLLAEAELFGGSIGSFKRSSAGDCEPQREGTAGGEEALEGRIHSEAQRNLLLQLKNRSVWKAVKNALHEFGSRKLRFGR